MTCQIWMQEQRNHGSGDAHLDGILEMDRSNSVMGRSLIIHGGKDEGVNDSAGNSGKLPVHAVCDMNASDKRIFIWKCVFCVVEQRTPKTWKDPVVIPWSHGSSSSWNTEDVFLFRYLVRPNIANQVMRVILVYC
ncbi:superoxide dismutase family protein [Paenibacillus sp. N3/727]|uniref:superoxide dismutase family protein n=1 Tax=Paenibacillus sp. N3/727 TaxID=2925845 RepID=UPI001F532812|nr:superoxide dismutase family protein [Paenibacillus sp. N3/727]UNK19364.1 superoxide dismutase family protein [Paenibacillus sp. N3/727]